ncbi:MAG: ABC transporter ATP-binding protein [Candidatus Glassbacteria bacterium]
MELKHLRQKYEGRDVLKDVSLKLEEGEFCAIIGPTGAGKTTLLRLMTLLDIPAGGRLIFNGIDVTRSRRLRLKVRRRMALVQQKPVVFSMSVYDNVALGLVWRGEERRIIRRKVHEILDRVEMMDYRDRNARTLSGGEVQRVALARALVTEPEVLLLDEPTSNLDPVSVLRMEDLLEKVIGRKRTTVIMATHDMAQGQRLADRIGVMIKGEILQMGSPGEIFCSPRSQEVAEFVGFENILSGVIVEKDDGLAVIDIDGNSIQVVSDCAVGDRVEVFVNPRHITFTLSRDTSSARNAIVGRISRLTQVGSLVRIELDCGFPLLGVLTTRSAQELEFTIGKRVFANFKATSVHVHKRGSGHISYVKAASSHQRGGGSHRYP